MRSTLLFLILLCRLAPAALGQGATASIAATANPAAPKKEQVLAVMDIVNNTGEFSAFVEGMPDMLITELMQSGDVKLVERTKVQTAMKALKLETSGLTQEHNLELGKWLGVDGILFGTFNRMGDKYRLDVRAIDVQTGKINVAASAVCDKQNVLDIVPAIGLQLRGKLADMASAKPSAAALGAPPPRPPAADSCPLEIQYRMMVSLLAEVAIPHQRVRVYLDNHLWRESGVVDELNRNFVLCQGAISVGRHTLMLVHGAVDKRGRWVRELDDQPKLLALTVRKDDRPFIQYKMEAHDRWSSYSDYTVDFYQTRTGE